VAIAHAEAGAPVLGVTYNPIKEGLFWAARGMGCHMDGRPVQVTTTRTLDHARVLASRSETSRGVARHDHLSFRRSAEVKSQKAAQARWRIS